SYRRRWHTDAHPPTDSHRSRLVRPTGQCWAGRPAAHRPARSRVRGRPSWLIVPPPDEPQLVLVDLPIDHQGEVDLLLALVEPADVEEPIGLGVRLDEAFAIRTTRRVRVLVVVGADDGEDPLGRLRSEAHTSELQSREKLVCRLLLAKKK